MSMAHIRSQFSRKTVAIAMAGAVAVGGVQITAPNANFAPAVASAEETDTLTGSLNPKVAPVEETTWFYTDAEGKSVGHNRPSEGTQGPVFVVASTDESNENEIIIPGFGNAFDTPKLTNPAQDDVLEAGEGYNPRNYDPDSAYKYVMLKENGDLVVQFSENRDNNSGYLITEIQDANGELHNTAFNIFTTFNRSVPDYTLKRDPASNEWTAFVPQYHEYAREPEVVFLGENQIPGATLIDEEEPGPYAMAEGLRVPGEGTWTTTFRYPDPYEEGVTGGTEVRFTPEKGFTGAPTLPNIGILDSRNYLTAQAAYAEFGENFPENAAPFIIYSISEETPPEDIYVKDVTDNGNGVYTIIRNDGASWPIDTSGDVNNIKPDGKGNLVVTIDGKDQKVPLDKVKVTEANKGTKNHTITITVPGSKPITFNVFDIHVTDVTKDGDGVYTIHSNGDESWTINMADAYARLDALENTNDPTRTEFDKLNSTVTGINNQIEKLDNTIKNNKFEVLSELKKEVGNLNKRLGALDGKIKDLKDQDIKEVRDNKDGTYTLIRNNGKEVNSVIDTSGNVTKIVSDGKGNLVVTIDGEDQTVPLDKVKITETNKNKINHTITIAVPGGNSVTFDAYDNYITGVTKDKETGNYIVTRNDGATWEINLKDIRDQITALEKKDSPTRAEFDKLAKELDDLDARVTKEFKDIDNHFTKVEGDIKGLRADLTTLKNRVTKIEARVTVVEDRADDLTRCVYSSRMVDIPVMLSIPLLFMAQLNIPDVQDINTQIQKQIGIYNKDAANAWAEHGGILQAGIGLAGLAAMIGGIAYLANECAPLGETQAAQETGIAQLSSKTDKGDSNKDDSDAKTATEKATEKEVATK